jgi:PAS domain S-box-containing protein
MEALSFEKGLEGALLRSLDLRIAVLDGAGTVCAVNEAWSRFAEQEGGERLASAVGPGARYLEVCRRSAAAGCPWALVVLDGLSEILAGKRLQFTLEYPCLEEPGGEERWFLLHATPLPGGGAVATHIDVTDHRQAEERLVRQQADYQLLLDAASDLISLHSAESVFSYASPACERLLGYQAAELVGHAVWGFLHPDDLAHAHEVHDRFKQHSLQEVVALRWRHKNGSHVWLESTLRRLSEHDEQRQVIAINRDITERKRAEQAELSLRQALERSAYEWRSTFDAIESPIVLLGFEGRVRRINRASKELLGLSYPEIIGRPVAELATRQPWQAVAALALDIAAGQPPQVCEARDDAAGKTWEVEGCVSAASDDGEARMIIQVRDISATVALHDALRRSETMGALGAVVAGVAHEVRNPLFGISAVLDACEKRYGDRPEVQRYFPLLRSELGRLTDLMRSLLDYGKPTRLAPAQGDLAEVLHEALALCRPLAEERQVELAVCGAPPAGVAFDRPQLTQAVKNVVENAVQHSPRGGRVTVEAGAATESGAAWARLAVRDQGPGFQPQDLPKVFEPFFSRRESGTGLGLSIVARVVEGHGGRVRARNHPQGGGLVEIEIPHG